MQSLSLYQSDEKTSPIDIALEINRIEELLGDRQKELTFIQEEFREFKIRYTQIVGGQLSELIEIERAIKEAEKRIFNPDEGLSDDSSNHTTQTATIKGSIRKLFWSVAKMFHPDHASDKHEAERRHAIMVEANRAYEEGDAESLHTLLGNEDIYAYCAVSQDTEDMASKLLRLKEELRTIEFGIKRIKQDGLYQLKLKADAEAKHGRDVLAQKAEDIRRQIIKARHKLEHLGDYFHQGEPSETSS
jgi:hypothetical protein